MFKVLHNIFFFAIPRLLFRHYSCLSEGRIFQHIRRNIHNLEARKSRYWTVYVKGTPKLIDVAKCLTGKAFLALYTKNFFLMSWKRTVSLGFALSNIVHNADRGFWKDWRNMGGSKTFHDTGMDEGLAILSKLHESAYVVALPTVLSLLP